MKNKLVSLNISFVDDEALYYTCYSTLQNIEPEKIIMIVAKSLGEVGMPDPSLAFSGKFVRMTDPEGRAAKIKAEDYGLYNLIFNPANTYRLLALATALRTIYPYETDQLRTGIESPLSWALRNKVYFPLGSNYYITPVTESFRRHLIFRLNDVNNARTLGRVLEIKIPGMIPDENHRVVEERDVAISAKIRARWPNSRMAPPVSFISLLDGDYQMYNQTIHFGAEEKVNKACNIVVFEGDRGRRATNLSVKDLKEIAKHPKYQDNPKTVVEQIARQSYQVLAMLHILGYHGAHSNGTDAHMENYGLSLQQNGIEVEAVNDLSSFNPWFGTKEADIEYLAQGSSRILGLSYFLPNREGLSVADCEKIYYEERTALELNNSITDEEHLSF